MKPLDTLRRFFGDTRPIDWTMLVVELLVLVLIAYEVIGNVSQHRKSRRLTKIVLNFVAAGQAIRNAAPGASADRDNVSAWKESVDRWVQDTHDRLNSYSAHAASSFGYPPSRNAGEYRGVHADANGYFGSLLQRIEILEGIAEKSNAYL